MRLAAKRRKRVFDFDRASSLSCQEKFTRVSTILTKGTAEAAERRNPMAIRPVAVRLYHLAGAPFPSFCGTKNL